MRGLRAGGAGERGERGGPRRAGARPTAVRVLGVLGTVAGLDRVVAERCSRAKGLPVFKVLPRAAVLALALGWMLPALPRDGERQVTAGSGVAADGAGGAVPAPNKELGVRRLSSGRSDAAFWGEGAGAEARREFGGMPLREKCLFRDRAH